MQETLKTNMQLMARCIYNPNTGKVRFENYSKYYPQIKTATA